MIQKLLNIRYHAWIAVLLLAGAPQFVPLGPQSRTAAALVFGKSIQIQLGPDTDTGDGISDAGTVYFGQRLFLGFVWVDDGEFARITEYVSGIPMPSAPLPCHYLLIVPYWFVISVAWLISLAAVWWLPVYSPSKRRF